MAALGSGASGEGFANNIPASAASVALVNRDAAGHDRDAGSTPSPSAAPSPANGSGDAVGEQTHDQPQSNTPEFEARARALWDAIAADKPESARASFFPLAAYEKVKAVGNPAGDWRVRLVGAYERDIHDLHLQLGARASRATFVSLEVPDGRARWVEPGEEYNKLGYYRVFGSKLKYEVDGHPHAIPVKSLISWRGQWYVVHLSGIK